jgi:NADH:ubiquinone oxidoreductase subunit C
VSWDSLPGYVSVKESFGETTVTVERERIRDACAAARDKGFTFLADIVTTDYLGWGSVGVSGYFGVGNIPTGGGRDLNHPSTQGFRSLPAPKPKRFSLSYHLLAMEQPARRVRLQCWLDEGDPVPSVVAVWPTADWHEREQFDLMGVQFDGHPNLARLLMPDDWEGHPLRKDYPIGGEPVRFSDAQ